MEYLLHQTVNRMGLKGYFQDGCRLDLNTRLLQTAGEILTLQPEH